MYSAHTSCSCRHGYWPRVGAFRCGASEVARAACIAVIAAELSLNTCSIHVSAKICSGRLEDTPQPPKYCDVWHCTKQQKSIVIKSKKEVTFLVKRILTVLFFAKHGLSFTSDGHMGIQCIEQ